MTASEPAMYPPKSSTKKKKVVRSEAVARIRISWRRSRVAAARVVAADAEASGGSRRGVLSPGPGGEGARIMMKVVVLGE